jgi:hypothetical protein
MKPLKYHIPKLLVVLLSLISLAACNRKPIPTFSKDIAPIVHSKCSPCHHKNGTAPFELISYEDVAKRAKMIAFVTAKRYMPPWPADQNYSHFLNERVLSVFEIEQIQNWFKNKCPQGDLSALKYPDFIINKSLLGKPDLILSFQNIEISNDNKDRFYVVKLPYEMRQERYVRALEFVPGQYQYAHHVNGHYLRYSDQSNPFSGRTKTDIESPNYTKEFKEMNLLNSDGTLPFRVHSAVNYLPGAFGIRYPAGIGGFLMGKKGAFVANDFHFGPSRKSLIDSSKIYVYFSDKAPQRPTYEIMMGTNGVSEILPPLVVDPNTISKHVSKLTIYNDISVLTVNPHMHLIGKSFKAYALKPNGDTLKLISIPNWQFRWQYFYTYQTPQKVPKGSTIVLEAIFDNTLKNPNNPNNPPRQIGERLDNGGASMRTTDEMLQFIITYMPYQKGDELIDLSKP